MSNTKNLANLAATLDDASSGQVLQSTGSGGVQFAEFEAAKAWFNFNGTSTITLRDDFNISSLSDQGTGDHHLNLQNAMSSVNNASATDCNNGDGGYNRNGSVAFATTSRLDLLTYNTGYNNLTDLSHNMGSVHGDAP